MPTTYTSLLGLALPATGELSGTWGSTVNTEITSLLDTAVAGTTTLSTDTDVTLSTTTGAANQARQAIILWTANGTVTRNITAPAASKTYVVINASAGTQSIVFRGVGPTAGVTVVKGESAVVAWNGSDFIKVSNTSGAGAFTNLSVSGTTTLSGLTASTALALDASKNVVSVTNTGTGNNVLATSPVLTTPNLGTPSAATLTNATGLPVSTGISGLGTGVATALAVNTGAAGAFVVNGGALGTPSSGTVTNLTGTASININGTVGATTPNTGAFTTLSASGVATFSAGTAAAPALTTIGDTDTGVFFPAANNWAVATGGVQALAVDPSGGLAVRGSATFGSTTVAGNTQINLASGTSDYTGFTRYSTGLGEIRHFGTAAFQLVTHNAADILFYANNSERMRITSGGNVAIGGQNAVTKLAIYDSNVGLVVLNTSDPAAATSAPMLRHPVASGFSSTPAFSFWYSNAGMSMPAAETLGLVTNNQERMRITSAGDVGIGTTSPSVKLHVLGSATLSGQANVAARIGAGIDSDLLLGSINGNTPFVASQGAWPLAFFVNGQERMRISSGGNVGIGTTDPQATLHVAGTILSATPFGNLATLQAVGGTGFRWTLNNDGTYRLQRTTDAFVSVITPMLFDASGNVGIGTTSPAVRLDVAEADITQLRVRATTNGVDTRLNSLGQSANAGVVGTYSNHPFLLYTNSSERMRIDSAGNVGIGTTSPVDRLAVVGSSSGGSVIARVTNSASAVNSAAVISFDPNGNGSNVRDAQIRGINVNGITQTALAFLTANGATPVEYMRITHDGNVGIGTQTPAVKLEVAGQIRTEAPTGGTAANWRLGTVHTVSPTSPNRTIEVDIGGTIYYLHAKTTNN